MGTPGGPRQPDHQDHHILEREVDDAKGEGLTTELQSFSKMGPPQESWNIWLKWPTTRGDDSLGWTQDKVDWGSGDYCASRWQLPRHRLKLIFRLTVIADCKKDIWRRRENTEIS